MQKINDTIPGPSLVSATFPDHKSPWSNDGSICKPLKNEGNFICKSGHSCSTSLSPYWQQWAAHNRQLTQTESSLLTHLLQYQVYLRLKSLSSIKLLHDNMPVNTVCTSLCLQSYHPIVTPVIGHSNKPTTRSNSKPKSVNILQLLSTSSTIRLMVDRGVARLQCTIVQMKSKEIPLNKYS